MRLLNVNTFELENFYEEQRQQYAILSHTWGEAEVSYQEILRPQTRDLSKFEKIANACKLAREDGWFYIWIDTCCIDKTSSAELSEAINSMYRWYENAQVCYAYLEDVSIDDEELFTNSRFKRSRWFTRGWTLQELLAPEYVFFYARDWKEIGSRSGLVDAISSASGIGVPYLQRARRARLNEGYTEERWDDDICAAVKLSWASNRQTTRVEDMSYCLLGLFDINMPLLYGEGHRAFERLQIEIFKRSNDTTIFAWRDPSLLCSGIFARRPQAFQDSWGITRLEHNSNESRWDVGQVVTSARIRTRDVDWSIFCDKTSERANALQWEMIRHRLLDHCGLTAESPTFSVAIGISIQEQNQRGEEIVMYIMQSKNHSPASVVRILPDLLLPGTKSGSKISDERSAIWEITFPNSVFETFNYQGWKPPPELSPACIDTRDSPYELEKILRKGSNVQCLSPSFQFEDDKIENRSAFLNDEGLARFDIRSSDMRQDRFFFRLRANDKVFFELLMWLVPPDYCKIGMKIEVPDRRNYIAEEDDQRREMMMSRAIPGGAPNFISRDLSDGYRVNVDARPRRDAWHVYRHISVKVTRRSDGLSNV